ncbi:MAG: hypothetical protein K2O65_16620, partial [Lachnospiraceae bacterium]|nr:hypothetical protein [Lachnospiraceae bacterium]
ILDKEIKKVDLTVVSAMKILSEQFVAHLKSHFIFDKGHRLERNDMMSFEQFVRTFDKQFPPFSLLFSAEGMGYFAFCAQL